MRGGTGRGDDERRAEGWIGSKKGEEDAGISSWSGAVTNDCPSYLPVLVDVVLSARLGECAAVPVPVKDKSHLTISWTAVTYRSVLLICLMISVILALGSYIILPEQTKSVLNQLSLAVNKFVGSGTTTTKPASGPHNASFTFIDGTVRVKKANSNSWVAADYSTPLEKGDIVQTGSEGIAKIVFADLTSYSLKQDSLIVIEENATTASQTTKVAVQLTTGTVDLSTGTYSQGSESQVIVAGATATFAPESTAMVHNDPRQDQHEILVKRGSGQVSRNNQVVRLADYERVSFQSDSASMTKTKEIAPPTLIAPANMAPIFVASPSTNPVDFSWAPVSGAHVYHVQISRNPYFSSTVFDKNVGVPLVKVPGLAEGAYYWQVQSIDSGGRESVESERNRFTVIAKGNEGVPLPLELDPFVQHGHVIEVKGKTEPNARVMVNGQEVPVIAQDGAFQFFTPPLPNGENVITVTAQNAKGGVKTAQKTIVIQ